ncbi:MAG: NADPH-Fe(3+) oxidoreductase subunit beta [Burkholderiaceae bacterium]|nr:NADPH-Fe(3+) oxidoreductase subunit beta [Burkholderiaceae bacterium]
MNQALPTVSPTLWTTRSSRVRKTGTWRTAAPHYHATPAPCLAACPVNGRIAEWIGEMRNDNLRRAWDVLVDNNPFPAIAGRICHHPCESACNRQFHDQAVSICALERVAGDAALAAGWRFAPPAEERGERVAIVGGGPAGLSAAYQLRRRGIQVSLFESMPKLGGLMRYGIPDYRLDKAVLDGEIGRIVDLGIDLHLGHAVGGAEALQALRERHDAVYLATGASLAKRLPGLDYGKAWLIDSAEFLAAANSGAPVACGERVVVVGGGSAAMDVARTARRLGKQVTVLALEPEAKLPAQRVEVDEAVEEGVRFVCGAMLRSTQAGPAGLALECVRVDFAPGAKRGEFSVTPVAGSAFTLEADAVVPSIGQDADVERWRALVGAHGRVLGTDRTWRTSAEGIFAGGDVASMDRFVTQAVGMGKQAAIEIARYVAGEPAGDGFEVGATVPFGEINTHYYPGAERNEAATAAPEQRLQGFGEVQRALTAQQAHDETQRCFSCGTCTHCDNCYYYCPDIAIEKTDVGYAVKYDYCKGCGLCVEECPTGSVTMRAEAML